MLQHREGKFGKFKKLSGLAVFSAAVFVFGLAFVSPALASTSITVVPSEVGNTSDWEIVGSATADKVSAVSASGDHFIQNNQTQQSQDFVMTNLTFNNIPDNATNIQVEFHAVVKDSSLADSDVEFRLLDRFNSGAGSALNDPEVVPSATSLFTDTILFGGALTTNPVSHLAWTVNDVRNWPVNFEVTQSNASLTAIDQISAIVTFDVPAVVPRLVEITPIQTDVFGRTGDFTPSYTFNSNIVGTITYGGDCVSSASPLAVVGNNTVTFDTLPLGNHSNCTIQVAGSSGNTSNVLAISRFTIAPFITEVTPIPNPTDNIAPSYTFNSNVDGASGVEGSLVIFGGCTHNGIFIAHAGNNTLTFDGFKKDANGNDTTFGQHANCSISLQDSAGDSSNNLVVTPFTIKHNIVPPVITAPLSVSVTVSAPTSSVVNFALPTAFDAFDNAATPVTCSNASGTVFPFGITTVTCTSADSENNIATSTFDVTVQIDTVAPVIAPHANVTAAAVSRLGASVTYTLPVTTDNIDAPGVATCSPASGVLFSIGTTPVTCTATDTAGNQATPVTFNVIVADTVSPTITLNGNSTIFLNVGDTYVEQGATAIDDIDGPVGVEITGTVDTSTPNNYFIAYKAQDRAGNFTVDNRTVIVLDPDGPKINPISDTTTIATNANGAVVAYGVVTFTDQDNTSTPIIGVCTPVSNSTFHIGTTKVICSAVDSKQRVGSGIGLNVIVQDKTAPVFGHISNITVEATSSAGASVPFTLTATDNVDGDVSASISCDDVFNNSITRGIHSGYVFPVGFNVVNCIAVDAARNIANTAFAVTVQDTTAPSITVNAGTLALEANIPLGGARAGYTVTALDIVDGVISSKAVCSPLAGSIFPLGLTTITCTVKDAHGNSATSTATVNVLDTLDPEITLNGSDTTTLTVGDVYAELGATTTDNYYVNVPVIIGGDVVDTNTVGTYHVTYDAVDGSNNGVGHTNRKTRTVIVNSAPAPAVSGGGGGGYVAPAAPVALVSNNPIVVTGSGDNLTAKLTFSMQNATMMAISEDPNFVGGSWLAYSANPTFTLSKTNTNRKIYVKFRGANGGETKTQEVIVPSNSSSLVQAVLGVKVTRVAELTAKLKVGSHGAQVVELQNLLKKAGFFPAKQAATGVYGAVTKAAVKKYLASLK